MGDNGLWADGVSSLIDMCDRREKFALGTRKV
jgi:hypothetical protein